MTNIGFKELKDIFSNVSIGDVLLRRDINPVRDNLEFVYIFIVDKDGDGIYYYTSTELQYMYNAELIEERESALCFDVPIEVEGYFLYKNVYSQNKKRGVVW